MLINFIKNDLVGKFYKTIFFLKIKLFKILIRVLLIKIFFVNKNKNEQIYKDIPIF